MADSNSLTLLPPLLASSSSPKKVASHFAENRASDRSGATSAGSDRAFEQKLEKAQKLKSHLSKQNSHTPVSEKPKPKSAKDQSDAADTQAIAKSGAEPSSQASDADQTNNEFNAKDAASKSAADQEQASAGDQTIDEQNAKAKDTATDLASAVGNDTTDETIKTTGSGGKKFSKAIKAVETSAPASIVPPITASQTQPIVKPVAAKVDSTKSPNSSAKPGASKAIGDGTNADGSDSGDETARSVANPSSTADLQFGTGKVLGRSGGGKRNASGGGQTGSAAEAGNDSATSGASNNAAILSDAGGLGTGDAGSKLDSAADPAGTSALPSVGAAGGNLAGSLSSTAPGEVKGLAGKIATAPVVTPQARFVEENHPKIVTGISGQLLPQGGTMQLRLDPAELGSMNVTVHLHDGVMTASFETSNDDATKLLSHSLGQLKSSLEAAGVSVDKIHVEQAPKQNSQRNSDSQNDSRSAPQEQQRQAQQDQQRREMVQRMWRKLAGGDPLDLVA